jgi:hypothetical protein
MLAGWNVPEPTPSFVFLGEETRMPSRSGTDTSWWQRLLAPFRAGGPAGFGLGLATASAAALVVALTGFRVEKVDGGLAFRFGEPEQSSSAALTTTPSLTPGGSLELASTGSSPASSGDRNAYVTRAEVEEIATQMVGSVVDLLNQHGDRQNREFSGVLHAMYEDISDRQYRESEELRSRMNSIGLELLLRQTSARSESRNDSVFTATSIEPREPTTPWRTLDWKEEWR